MIVAACANPALDVTYRIDRLTAGESHRVRKVSVRAGGKGTNVARLVLQLGTRSRVVAPVGGESGAQFVADLDRAGIVHATTQIGGSTRRCVVVVDDKDATVFNEPGPTLQAPEWDEFRVGFATALDYAAVAVIAGSCPLGTPVQAYYDLIMDAAQRGVPSVLDAEGDALRAGLEAGPTLVKVNQSEARGVTGHAEASEAARALRAAGAQWAVVTGGPAGLVAVSDRGMFTARVRTPVKGDPTGAGDAVTAVLAQGLARGAELHDLIAEAAAVSAAAVLVDGAGEYDARALEALRADTVMEQLR